MGENRNEPKAGMELGQAEAQQLLGCDETTEVDNRDKTYDPFPLFGPFQLLHTKPVLQPLTVVIPLCLAHNGSSASMSYTGTRHCVRDSPSIAMQPRYRT